MFRLVLPLPFPGLDSVNAYLLRATDDTTLVDCGIRNPSGERDFGWSDLVAALAACDVRPREIERLVVTHTHIDHYGMAGRLVDETGCDLWMHRAATEDIEIYREPESAARKLKQLFADHGAPTDELDQLAAYEDWRAFVSRVVEPKTPLDGGETFTVGGRSWSIVYTPGHSRSHVCIWAPEERILISGDHLLPTVTPHIDFARGGEQDPLGRFLESLEKVEQLDPAIVLPGHGRPFVEGAERARVVARHHDRRLGSILQVIRYQPRSASDIVDAVFGPALLHFERRLALGEALAHLAYLRKRGEVERIEQPDGTFLYKKVSRRRLTEVPE